MKTNTGQTINNPEELRICFVPRCEIQENRKDAYNAAYLFNIRDVFGTAEEF